MARPLRRLSRRDGGQRARPVSSSSRSGGAAGADQGRSRPLRGAAGYTGDRSRSLFRKVIPITTRRAADQAMSAPGFPRRDRRSGERCCRFLRRQSGRKVGLTGFCLRRCGFDPRRHPPAEHRRRVVSAYYGALDDALDDAAEVHMPVQGHFADRERPGASRPTRRAWSGNPWRADSPSGSFAMPQTTASPTRNRRSTTRPPRTSPGSATSTSGRHIYEVRRERGERDKTVPRGAAAAAKHCRGGRVGAAGFGRPQASSKI